jgi:uncharacterized protein (DUF1330 family)
MAKGYWIAHVDVRDAEGDKLYRDANAIAFAKHCGRFLVRGAPSVQARSALRERHIVIEFPSYQGALDYLESHEYGEAVKHRDVSSDVDLVVIEGYDGRQPG